jgi:putative membrane protein
MLHLRQEYGSMNVSLKTLFPVLLGGGLILSAAAAPKLNGDDLDFVNGAAKGGTTEVALGRLAAEKSSNPSVQAFANRMIHDHSEIDIRLATLAASKGVELPDGKGLMNDATYLELKVLSGKEFDKAYVKAMLADHKNDVSSFEKEMTAAQDPDVKNFVAKTLPILREHLSMIQKIQSETDMQ